MIYCIIRHSYTCICPLSNPSSKVKKRKAERQRQKNNTRDISEFFPPAGPKAKKPKGARKGQESGGGDVASEMSSKPAPVKRARAGNKKPSSSEPLTRTTTMVSGGCDMVGDHQTDEPQGSPAHNLDGSKGTATSKRKCSAKGRATRGPGPSNISKSSMDLDIVSSSGQNKPRDNVRVECLAGSQRQALSILSAKEPSIHLEATGDHDAPTSPPPNPLAAASQSISISSKIDHLKMLLKRPAA